MGRNDALEWARVWLHVLVDDQADLGQRATALPGHADDTDTRHFLETDDGKRVQPCDETFDGQQAG
jgi:hypothetical protein